MKRFLRFLTTIIAAFIFTTAIHAGWHSLHNTPTSYINIGNPYDILVMGNGDIWYTDAMNYRIVKLNSDWETTRTIGRQGEGEGEFSGTPVSITKDLTGNLYVLESDSCRIDKFDFNGGFIQSWGSCGEEQNQMSYPTHIHYDSSNDFLYILDPDLDRVLRFDTSGSYLGSFVTGTTGVGGYAGPRSVTTDNVGNIYILDAFLTIDQNYIWNGRIRTFDSNWNLLQTIGPATSGDYQIKDPQDIIVLNSGDILASASTTPLTPSQGIIKKFNSSGIYISEWSPSGYGVGTSWHPSYLGSGYGDYIYISDYNNNTIQKYTSDGVVQGEFRNSSRAAGKFYSVVSGAYDSAGNLYSLDRGFDGWRVQKFTNSGNYLAEVISSDKITPQSENSHPQISIDASDRIFVVFEGRITVFDLNGTQLFAIDAEDGNHQFRDVAFDSTGRIYALIANSNTGDVKRYSSIGNVDLTWSLSGTLLVSPWGLMTDPGDNVYVLENPPGNGINAIAKFEPDGSFLSRFGPSGQGAGQIGFFPHGVIDANNNIFIAGFYKLTVFDANGTYQYDIGEYGSGNDQLCSPYDVILDQTGGGITVADPCNSRFVTMDFGTKIQHLIPTLDVFRMQDNFSLVQNFIDPETQGSDSINAIMYSGPYAVAGFTVDLTADRNWPLVNSIALPEFSKTLVTSLNPTDAPGLSATHSIYVVKQSGQHSVIVCPDAALIADVTPDCPNGYELIEGDPLLSSVDIDGINYWKIDGLTGTGAMSYTTKGLAITANNYNVSISEPITLTVNALNSINTPDSYYRGTVHFSSTSGTAVLPSNFTFTDLDNGTFTFTDQLYFTEGGDYTVTVTDTVDGSLTATTANIHVEGVTPLPTPTYTSVPPTNTPGPTSTPRPTNTRGPSPTPSPTVTFSPSVTPSLPAETCEQNPIQIQCQIGVEIYNPSVTVIDESSARVCWTTNIEAKSVIYYGLYNDGTYNLSSDQESDYKIDHCITLQSLSNNTKYIYRISSTSPAGRTAYFESNFTVGVETLPGTGGTAEQCIQIADNNSYSFNSSNQVLLNYKTASSSTCNVDYGISTQYGNLSTPSMGINHISTLNLLNLNGTSDLYYRIRCTAVNSTNQCVSKNVIPVAKYFPYFKPNAVANGSPFSNFINDWFGTSSRTSQTLTIGAVEGIIIAATSATLAYPQWLTYGFLWIKQRKKKVWGLVFDFKTNKPIPFAVISVYKIADGTYVKQAITDTQGRYGFVLDTGTYTIKVNQSGYEAFEHKINITKSEEAITLDIPLINAAETSKLKKLQEILQKIFKILSPILLITGILLTIIAVILKPNILNIIIFAIYICELILIIILRTPRSWGYLYNSATGERISNAFVRLFDFSEGRQVDVQIVDSKGRFGFVTKPKKDYYLKVDATGYRFPSYKDNSIVETLQNGHMFVRANPSEGVNTKIALDPD